jgi:hypothetical protein
MLNDIILIGVVCLAYLYWFNAQKAREIALRAAMDHCLEMEVQMLDGYVALNGIWLKRDNAGKILLHRLFLFEFSSTGNERYNGTVLMRAAGLSQFIWNPIELTSPESFM